MTEFTNEGMVGGMNQAVTWLVGRVGGAFEAEGRERKVIVRSPTSLLSGISERAQMVHWGSGKCYYKN